MSASSMRSAAALTVLVQISRLGGNLALIPLALTALGHTGYASFAIALAYVSAGTLLESFLTPVLRNQLTASRARNCTNELREAETVVHTSLNASILFAFTALTVYQGLAAVGFPLSSLVNATVFAALVVVASGFVEADFAASEELSKLRGFELLATLGGLAAAYAVLVTRPTPQDALAILAASTGIGKIAAYFVSAHRRGRRSDCRSTIRFFLVHKSQGGFFAFGQACLLANSVIPISLLGQIGAPDLVNLFSVVQRVVSAPANLVTGTFSTFWSAISRALVEKRLDWVRRLTFKVATLIACGTAIAGAASALYGPLVISVWTKNVIQATPTFIASFAFCVGCQTLQSWFSVVSNASGQFAAAAKTYIILCLVQTLVIVITLSFFGVTPMVIGMGAAALFVGVGGLLLSLRWILE